MTRSGNKSYSAHVSNWHGAESDLPLATEVVGLYASILKKTARQNFAANLALLGRMLLNV